MMRIWANDTSGRAHRLDFELERSQRSHSSRGLSRIKGWNHIHPATQYQKSPSASWVHSASVDKRMAFVSCTCQVGCSWLLWLWKRRRGWGPRRNRLDWELKRKPCWRQPSEYQESILFHRGEWTGGGTRKGQACVQFLWVGWGFGVGNTHLQELVCILQWPCNNGEWFFGKVR